MYPLRQMRMLKYNPPGPGPPKQGCDDAFALGNDVDALFNAEVDLRPDPDPWLEFSQIEPGPDLDQDDTLSLFSASDADTADSVEPIESIDWPTPAKSYDFESSPFPNLPPLVQSFPSDRPRLPPSYSHNGLDPPSTPPRTTTKLGPQYKPLAPPSLASVKFVPTDRQAARALYKVANPGRLTEGLVHAWRDRDAKVFFLTTNALTKNAGYDHIMATHGKSFHAKGWTSRKMGHIMEQAMKQGRVIGHQNVERRSDTRPIFEFQDRGETHHIAITYTPAGYIVGSNIPGPEEVATQLQRNAAHLGANAVRPPHPPPWSKPHRRGFTIADALTPSQRRALK